MKYPISPDLQRLPEREDKEDEGEENIGTNNVKMELDLNGLKSLLRQLE